MFSVYIYYVYILYLSDRFSTPNFLKTPNSSDLLFRGSDEITGTNTVHQGCPGIRTGTCLALEFPGGLGCPIGRKLGSKVIGSMELFHLSMEYIWVITHSPFNRGWEGKIQSLGFSGF